MVKCGTSVLATALQSSAEVFAENRNALYYPQKLELPHMSHDFDVHVQVYTMVRSAAK